MQARIELSTDYENLDNDKIIEKDDFLKVFLERFYQKTIQDIARILNF